VPPRECLAIGGRNLSIVDTEHPFTNVFDPAFGDSVITGAD
jgi:hypothetical protein